MTSVSHTDSTDVDVLVIGAGPAGMAVAVRAHENGAKVLILDNNHTLGGQIWHGGQKAHEDSQSELWFRKIQQARVPVLNGAEVFSAAPAEKAVLAETWDCTLEFRYKKLIIAAGAREIFLPFQDGLSLELLEWEASRP